MQRSRFLRVMGAFAAVAASLPLAGCGGGGSDGIAGPVPAPPSPAPGSPAPPPLPAPTGEVFAYVANADANAISIYKILASGALEPVDVVLPDSSVFSISVHPSGRFAYAMSEGAQTIGAYTINGATGMLEPLDTFTTEGFANKMHIHPSGEFAYIPGQGNSILIYGIGDDGALVEDGRSFDVGAGVGGIALAPAGDLLYVARVDEKVSSYSIDATGELTLRSTAETGGRGSEVAVAPSGDALYVAAGENICVHAINSGELGPARSVYASNVRAISVATSGKFVYAITFGGGNPNASVYEVGATGELSVKDQTRIETLDGWLALHPSGNLLYTANYETDTVAAFTVNQESGVLTEFPPSVATAHGPFHICVATVVAAE